MGGAFPGFSGTNKKRTLPARFSITNLITISGPNNSWKQFFRYGNALPISKELPRIIIPVGNNFYTDGIFHGRHRPTLGGWRLSQWCVLTTTQCSA